MTATPDLMRLQLGALFAAGHAPDAVAGWTWAQVQLASSGVQLYHADLAARLFTGKSPTVEAARRATPGPPADALPGESEVDREMRRLREIQQLQAEMAAMGGGFGLTITRGAASGSTPDG